MVLLFCLMWEGAKGCLEPAGELNTGPTLQMWWEHCKPHPPGEEKQQPGWPRGLLIMKSPNPGIGFKIQE